MVQTNWRTREIRSHNPSLWLTVSNVEAGTDVCREHSRRIFRYVLLESDQLLAVLVIEPLHFEVQVHIICAFTQAMLLMLWKKDLGLK